jgi:hypothetical protein
MREENKREETTMKKSTHTRPLIRILALAAGLAGATGAWATPSTQIWIPSTDIQPFGVVHLNVDTYIRSEKNDDGQFSAPLTVIGPTMGVLPFDAVQAEVGFDLMYNGSEADSYPFYGNAKVATAEGSFASWSPAIAVGGYNFGTKYGDARKGEVATSLNIVYGLVAKTVPVLGRLSAGYFVGNKKVLIDEHGDSDEKGVLLSWDRTLAEISDKLWVAVDYQGTHSAVGALSFGASWAFAKNASVILGYDIYNEKKTAGENTFTLQVDLNYP